MRHDQQGSVRCGPIVRARDLSTDADGWKRSARRLCAGSSVADAYPPFADDAPPHVSNRTTVSAAPCGGDCAPESRRGAAGGSAAAAAAGGGGAGETGVPHAPASARNPPPPSAADARGSVARRALTPAHHYT
eukprot:gene3088-biopygen10412